MSSTEWARAALLLHAVSSAALVGAATHQLLWVLRGTSVTRERAMVRRILVLYGLVFALGATLYPTYKTRVRTTYFVDGVGAAAAGEPQAPRSLGWVGRLFDVKEHGAALGLAAAVGLSMLSRRAHPSRVPEARRLYLGVSLFVCATVWLAALIGVLVVSYRSVAAVP